MTTLLRTAKNAITYSTELREAIVKNPLNSLPQWTQGITASNSNVKPGATVSFNINYNSPDWEQEYRHYFYYGITNASTTDTITFKRGPIDHFEQIVITINDSSQTITLKNPAIREITSDWFLNEGLKMYQGRYFCFEEFSTFNGVSIAPNTTHYFYFPLDYLLSFAGTCIKGEIRNIKFDLTVLSEQSNAQNANKFCYSSSALNLWTQANISLVNLTYLRNFVLIYNPSLYVKLIGSLPSNVPLEHFTLNVPQEKVLYTGTWMTGQNFVIKASDIWKGNRIQNFSFYVRTLATGFNDATACLEYSGPNYLGWKVRQLNLGGNEKTLDLTDPRRQKNYAIKQYSLKYGRQQAPQAIWDTPSEQMTKYLIRMTHIDFDWLQEEQMHEVERMTDTNNSDWEITIVALGDVGANCQLVCCPVVSETYNYAKVQDSNYTVGQIAKV